MSELSITTERLVLRPFGLEDAPRVRELAGDWDVARTLVLVPHPYPEGVAEACIATHAQSRAAGTHFTFAVTLSGLCIGCIGLERGGKDHFELGYWFGTAHWGRGYATEAVTAVTGLAFGQFAKTRLIADHFVDNPRSGHVLSKAGFVETGRLLKYSLARGCESASITMALTRDAWAKKQV